VKREHIAEAIHAAYIKRRRGPPISNRLMTDLSMKSNLPSASHAGEWGLGPRLGTWRGSPFGSIAGVIRWTSSTLLVTLLKRAKASFRPSREKAGERILEAVGAPPEKPESRPFPNDSRNKAWAPAGLKPRMMNSWRWPHFIFSQLLWQLTDDVIAIAELFRVS
jgi:hypothetical protein